MDKLFVFGIRDTVAGSFGEPFICAKVELATRRFDYIMSNSQMVAKDCQLWKLGTYDIETGIIDSQNGVEFICDYNGGKENA